MLVLALTALAASKINAHLLNLARQAAHDEAHDDADAIATALQRELTKVDVITRAIRHAIEQSPMSRRKASAPWLRP